MANITTQTIRVDLSTGKVIPTAYTHQNDTARTLVFDMYNGGLPYDMTGNTVKFAYKSPIVDGQYTVITGSSMASGTVSGNKVTVALPVAYTKISGVGLLTMIITPSSGTIRPVNVRLVVQKSADGDDVIAGASDFPDAWMDEKVYSWLDDHIDGVFSEEQFVDAVDNWLDEHPEATTTVQDGSITIEKFANSVVDATLTQEGHPADANATGKIARSPLDINKQSAANENTFTIATFNVLGTNYWRYPANPPCDTDAALVAISRNILEVNPDIVGLQEVSKHPKYTQLEKICSVGYENKHFLGNHSVGIQNAFFGNAIISKNGFSFDSVEDTSWADQADEKRHLIKAVVTINDTPVSIYVTHLSLNDSNRDAEITDILSKISNDTNDHIILIGDLNLEYQSAEYNRFVSSGLINTNGTYPTYIGSSSIIDFIFHSSNITVNSYNVLENSDASDHALLWANLTVN